MAKQNVELKFSLKDGVSAGLASISKGIDGLNTKLGKATVAAGAATAALAAVGAGAGIAAGVTAAAEFEQAIVRAGRWHAHAQPQWPALRALAQVAPWLAECGLAWGVTGARAAGGSWKTAGVDARAVVSVPAGPLTWHLNVGHERDTQARSSTTAWGLALEHEGFGPLAPMAEFFGDDREAAWWNLGLRYTLAKDKAYIDMSYGRQMTGVTPSLLTAGFKLVF